ncbi:fumarylacetoacetate hydrolase family protein [Streptomyces sp. S465]|uniref:fumarylacetoacetate hydrolase family protein n=1 Tax=Streptomyces sp. S465 TaxID=2979468 RepID=UPI0022A83F7B|nr:fumarylacetoacetate hydrolase family protein [Streptomyces sp. S465]WAP55010.1 fumarylacetoacetate hydrolase family protein [Streptomyces sp. S465]
MRIANLRGRAHLLSGPGATDIARASGGRFGPDPMDLFAHWDAFRTWARTDGVHPAAPYRREDLGAPVPRPGQVFAIGLNYAEHAAETGLEATRGVPSVFTKFTSSLTGPTGTVHLTGPSVDWEVELVVAIGKEAHHVAAADAWEHVAGVMVGQDFSDRDVQMSGTPPQFSLGKSYPGFGPTGPALVSLDEIAPDTPLRLRCWVNDELVQDGSTDQMIMPVPVLIERISSVCTLYPGDLVFTGTPAGVGMGRTPARYLASGDEVRTSIDGIGEMTHVLR